MKAAMEKTAMTEEERYQQIAEDAMASAGISAENGWRISVCPVCHQSATCDVLHNADENGFRTNNWHQFIYIPQPIGPFCLFVLLHEVGHAKLGHLVSNKTLPSELYKNELAASEYAVDTMLAHKIPVSETIYAFIKLAAYTSTLAQAGLDPTDEWEAIKALLQDEEMKTKPKSAERGA